MANYFNFPIGFVLSDALNFLSGAAIPLIIIYLGLFMELKGIKQYLTDAACKRSKTANFTRLSRLIVFISGLGGLKRTVTIIEASIPSSMLSVVLTITL
jgi:predicted permease